ncbi:ExeM/NucH family extracellular endonuclease [Nocardioides sp. SR21]|uniref:ExeM/NucH family extracellular endonuclease n=1 Tax=Nocardioides sp. SR21 TaxID=2919501 RepID=UPI001FAACDB4|nr:ExeM/NucH family extracellular endonuclease [Nocardioides sp. SR21]
MRNSWKRLVGPAAAVTLVASSLLLVPSSPAQANADGTGLVINEVYAGGGSGGRVYDSRYVELFNPTSTAINLASPQLYLIKRNATDGGVKSEALTGTIPAHGYFLVAGAGAVSTPPKPLTPAPDQTLTFDVSGTAGLNGVMILSTVSGFTGTGNLATNPSVIDAVGTGATYEGTKITASSDVAHSYSRTNHADSNNNAADFTAQTPSPLNSSTIEGGDPVPLAATDPADMTTFVDTAIPNITLQASGGTPPYSWNVTSLPTGITETSDGVVGGTPTVVGTSTVSATVTDSATPTAGTSTVEFTITVDPAPQQRTIAQIQGNSATTPENGKTVITQGVVTARYPSGDGNLAGFFLQTGGEEGVDYDTPGASDAIFVFSGSKTAPAIGATVEVRGVAGERFGSTQLNASTAANTITVLATAQPAVIPNDVVPGTDCALPGTDCLKGADLEEAREEVEGELFQPTGDYTVTDSYDGSPFTQSGSRGFAMQGEIGLAAESDIPLMIPTETIDQSDATGLAARQAYNLAHQLILDDGADIDYSSNTFEDQSFPWLTPTHPVRVGAPVTFPKPVVLRFDFDFWRLQPQTKVAAGEDGQDRVAIENTRTDAPADVLGDDGDLKIATFNMLNYFNTYGEAWAASDGNATGSDTSAFSLTNPRRCSFYTDRGPVPPATGTAARISNDTCIQDAIDPLTGLKVQLLGPRGAANEANFLRQEAKELEAINAIDADVMSLEEVENSIKLYDAAIDGPNGADKDRDDALKRLVLKLNEHWATNHPAYVGDRWAYVVSPRPEALPTVAEQDAIRSAFIYNPSKVETVGRSQVLVNSAPFRNAREPLAQSFKPLGGGREDAFIVIVNHFKSKGGPTAPATVNGDNVDQGDGAGFYNGDRKRQAAALVAFANQVSADKNIAPVFFTGDFNSYSEEDPVQVIEAAGYKNLQPTNGETTYSFGGLAGSLDHVFANPAALGMVTGEDVWSINAGESVYYEYSRFNANATNLYSVNPFRSSDHNPEIIGIDVGELTADPDVDTVQILATNDFHGRLVDDPGSAAAGAASMAGAVKELRLENANTIFAAAGDLIGASTFESFLQNDEPTIASLNEAGLEVSSVGNHEFDKGYNDLVTRVMPLTSWEYLGANVEFKDTEHGHEAGDPALPETWCETLPNGRVVGFVGAVTEDLDTLVSASAIEDIVVTSIVDAVNEHADELKGPDGCDEGVSADLVIELVHEGAASTAYAAVTDDSTFGKIVAGANENVDAIVSGHTHLAYNHRVPVPAWETEGRAVTERPVVSAGQYGANLNRLQFEFAPGDGDLVNIRQTVLQLKDYDADPDTQVIVDAAVAFAETEGAKVLGDTDGPFMRARRTGDDGQISESRGAESTLGNLIAEMQRWKTGADIGFMNPGGLRADLLGNGVDLREVTYRQAANTQPFANTLVTMDLTGAQIEELLEQQWQRDADGNIPSRPFLRLGTSAGFTSTFDASKPEGSRITGMWLDGAPLDREATYRVSATSFLAGAGDNFWELAEGENVQDTGFTDLQAVVEYLDAFGKHGEKLLEVDYGQHQVGIAFPGGAPSVYEPGDALAFNASSLAMTGVGDDVDTQVTLMLGDVAVGGPFTVNNDLSTELFDNFGKAAVTVTVPEVPDGTTVFTLVGNNTGTEIKVPVKTSDGRTDTTVTGDDQTVGYGAGGNVPVAVDPAGATGTVTLLDGETQLGQTTLSDGAGSIPFAAGLSVGDHELTLAYSGDATHSGSEGTVTVTVEKAAATIEATPTPASVTAHSGTSDITVTVGSAATGDPSGTVTASVGGVEVDSATLAGGAATLSVGPFSTAGDKTVTIAYSGDSETASGSTTTTVTVVAAETSVSATGGPATYGTSWGAVVTVDPDTATGEVEVLDGATSLGTATLTDGGATVAIGGTALQPGTHTLTVTYAGDGGHESSSDTFDVTVNKRGTTVSGTGGTFQVGTSWTSQVTVSPATATGQVEVLNGASSLGTATLGGGTGSVSIAGNALPIGTHSLTVNYAGDATHAASTSTVSVTVTGSSPSPTTVAATCPAVTFGTGWSAQVSVTPASAAGAVQVRAGATLLGSGTLTGGSASIAIDGTALVVGTHTLTVDYLGDGGHASSTTTCTVTVTAPPVEDTETTTSVSGPSVIDIEVAASYTITVTGAPPVTGTVELREGGTLIGTGQLSGAAGKRAQVAQASATITIPAGALAVGTHTLTASYLGDEDSDPSGASLEVEVFEGDGSLTPSTTSVTVEPGQVVVAKGTATVSVSVSADDVTPTGTVTLTVNGNQVSKSLVDGGASFVVGPFAKPGTKPIRVSYSGDDQVADSRASTSVKVSKAEPVLAVSHTPGKVKVDKTRAQLVVKVGADGFTPGGKVTIDVPGQGRQTVRIDDRGRAVFKLDQFQRTGEKVIAVSYGGDDRTTSATAEYTLHVVSNKGRKK